MSSTAPSKVTFVFVPGGFCPAYYFHKVVSILEYQGFNALSIDLPTMDDALREKGEQPGLSDDASLVRKIVSDQLVESDVVLVGSSYGGAVATEACKGITSAETEGERRVGGVKHLILLGSIIAEPGFVIGDLHDGTVPVDIEKPMGATPTHLDPLDPAVAGALLCGSLPKEEQEMYGRMGKPFSTKAFKEPLTFAAWETVPTTLVIGTNDKALPPKIQHEYFDAAVAKGVKGLKKVVIEGGDHLMMLSHPKETVQVCLEAAGIST